jgi:hypothetical protein
MLLADKGHSEQNSRVSWECPLDPCDFIVQFLPTEKRSDAFPPAAQRRINEQHWSIH